MKEEYSLSKKVATYLLENYQITTNKSGNLKIGDFSLSGNGQAKKVFNTFLNNRKKYKEIEPKFLEMNDAEILEEVSNILPSVKDLITDHLSSSEVDKVNREIGLNITKEAYLNVVPVVDMEDPKATAHMVDKETGEISPLIEKAWERIVGTKHAGVIREIGYCGRFEYNPRSITPFRKTTTSLGEETVYNKFIPPLYRKKVVEEEVLDPRFIEFLEGLFDEDCRDYAYNWLYHSCFKRIPVYLVLVGAGGIGKNLLAEALKYIHGPTNYTKAPASALDTKFNGHLTDCTMLYYDECKFSAGREGATTRKNKLKEWANDYVPIEIKGIDAVTKDIFCSSIIATNNDSDVHLEQLDRKFSVMQLSEERLEKRLGLENTQFLWEYIKEDGFADAFLNYLRDKIDLSFNPHVEYKGPKFQELVLSSLYGWQQDLLYNYILTSQTPYVSLKTCKEEISLFPKHNTKVDDFLKNFTWEGESIGKIVTIDGRSKIKINEKLLPPVKEEHPLDKGDL